MIQTPTTSPYWHNWQHNLPGWYTKYIDWESQPSDPDPQHLPLLTHQTAPFTWLTKPFLHCWVPEGQWVSYELRILSILIGSINQVIQTPTTSSSDATDRDCTFTWAYQGFPLFAEFFKVSEWWKSFTSLVNEAFLWCLSVHLMNMDLTVTPLHSPLTEQTVPFTRLAKPFYHLLSAYESVIDAKQILERFGQPCKWVCLLCPGRR